MNWDEVKVWRRAQREAVIARREGTPETERASWNNRITAHLVGGFEMPDGVVIGYCWPFRGEFDARFAVRRWRDSGATAALPEVVAKKTPLVFRKWWPGAPMRPGVYDIPVPNETEIVAPDVAIVPMNAFDECGYRLGYGGGFFDRTLAACGRRIIAIGVSYEMLRVPTIHPQQHDIPMDFVVTEEAIYSAGGKRLEAVEAAESPRRFQDLLAARGLPREAYRESGYSSPACYAADFPDYFRGSDADEAKGG
jgi:5,10-methenyltetrahydrofolate synthetase